MERRYMASATKMKKIKENNIASKKGGEIITPNFNAKNLIDYIENKAEDNAVKMRKLSYKIKKLENEENPDKRKIEELQAKLDELKELNIKNDALDYATNKNKCFDPDGKTLLISQLNCNSLKTIKEDFDDAEIFYHSHKKENCGTRLVKQKDGTYREVKVLPNEALHIINSFKGHKIPASKVHALNMEIAKRLAGEDYRVVVATHTNTDNYHSHIVLSCYNLNGYHKYYDSWNLGLKIQDIATEVGLENGCEIISKISDDYELEDDNIPTNESIKYRNTKKKGKIKLNGETFEKDVDTAIDEEDVKSWEDFTKKMKEKGYAIQENKKSYTYIYDKDNKYGKFRDNRHGYFYTKKGVEKRIAKKLRLATKEKYKIEITNDITPPKYEIKRNRHNRVPILIRFIKFVINIFRELLKNIQKAEIREYLKKEIEDMTNTLSLIEKYDLNNKIDVYAKRNELLKEYNANVNTLKTYYGIEKTNKKLLNAFIDIKDTQDKIEEYGYSDAEMGIITEYNEINIRENKAKLDPMEDKMKSRLYKTLYNSGFKLKYPYNLITQKQAQNICNFINKKTDKKPEELWTISEYMALKNSGNLPKYERNQNINKGIKQDIFKKLKEENADADKIETIRKYRNARNILVASGVIGLEEYYNDITERKNKVAWLQERQNDLKEKIEEVSKIDRFLSSKISNEILNLIENRQDIEDAIKDFNKENYTRIELIESLLKLFKNNELSDNSDLILAPYNEILMAQIIANLNYNDINVYKIDKDELRKIILNETYNIKDYVDELKDLYKEEYEEKIDSDILDDFMEMFEEQQIETSDIKNIVNGTKNINLNKYNADINKNYDDTRK